MLIFHLIIVYHLLVLEQIYIEIRSPSRLSKDFVYREIENEQEYHTITILNLVS